MKILAVRTGELPEVIDIEHSLDAESEFVGGYIQTISLSSTAILVCNDDGKVIGLKPNRVIPGDFIAGFFLLLDLMVEMIFVIFQTVMLLCIWNFSLVQIRTVDTLAAKKSVAKFATPFFSLYLRFLLQNTEELKSLQAFY